MILSSRTDDEVLASVHAHAKPDHFLGKTCLRGADRWLSSGCGTTVGGLSVLDLIDMDQGRAAASQSIAEGRFGSFLL